MALRECLRKELVREMTLLSCKEATHLVSQGLDRRLGFGERSQCAFTSRSATAAPLHPAGRVPAQGGAQPWQPDLTP